MRRVLATALFALLAACGSSSQPSPRDALRSKLLAAQPTGTRTLLVAVYGPGTGSFTSVPDVGLQCDTGVGLCWAYPTIGTPVTLTATASSGSVFVSWGGNCSGNSVCQLTMAAVQEVSAVFQSHSVTVVLNGLGQGSVSADSGGMTCDKGKCAVTLTNPAPATVTLTATPSSGSYFAGWWGEGCSGTGPCTVTADRARTVYATFQTNATAVNVWAPEQSGGGGTISASGAVESSCAVGGSTTNCTFHVDTTKLPQVVTLTATPDATSAFVSWGGSCSGSGPCQITVRGPVDVTAIFEPHTLAVTTQGYGQGTVTSSPDIGLACSSGTCTVQLTPTSPQTLTLIATPAQGSFFAGWWGEGCSGTDTCQVTTDRPRSVYAAFMPYNFPVTVTAYGSGGGWVSGAGTNTCAVGGSTTTCTIQVPNTGSASPVLLSATPDANSEFLSWGGACSGTEPCQLTVGRPMKVTATFQSLPGAKWVVTTLAGSPSGGYADGQGAAAGFYGPFGVAVDGAGNAFVTELLGCTIRKITPAGVVSTFAGTAGSCGSVDGLAVAARFFNPAGVAVDAAGNLYVVDTLDYTIRKVTPDGIVSTLAGTAGVWGAVDGTGAAAQFWGPWGAAVDGAGNVYVADMLADTVRKITPGGVVTTLAGTPGIRGSADGTGAAAQFNGPYGVAVDGSGNVYVADTSNYTIRKVTPDGIVSTFAGTPGVMGAVDGTGTAAQFMDPSGVAVDGAGIVYVADTYTIRAITPAGVVTTIAGAPGIPGIADGTGATARFSGPTSIATDGSGNIYVVDSTTIRKITRTSSTP